MDEWQGEHQAMLYSMWLVASMHQRAEHLISAMKRFGPNCYGLIHVHVTGCYWSEIPTGSCAFHSVFEGIKRFERYYPRCALKYSLILHGRKGAPKEHTKYMLGCTIKWAEMTGQLKISHVNRKVPVFVAMLKTARQYGADFEIEQPTQEQRLDEVRKRMLRRRVLGSN